MACVVAAESTRGNVVYVTDCEILKKRQDRGWSTPRLGQSSNPDHKWRMSRALKWRQGTFTVQWQRAHVAAADTKRENHDMALIFGHEMDDAVAKQAAKRHCEERQLSSGLGGCAGVAGPKGGSLRQTCKGPKHSNCVDQSRKGSFKRTVQNRLAVTFRTNPSPAGIWAFEAKV